MDHADLRDALDEIAADAGVANQEAPGVDEEWHEDELTQAQIQGIEEAEKFVAGKLRGQLMCSLWGDGFIPKPLLSVRWQGHTSAPASSESPHNADEGLAKLPHESFSEWHDLGQHGMVELIPPDPYHQKNFTKRLGRNEDFPSDEDSVYLDAEAHRKYESANIGTVTCEGYAIEIWEHELFFGEKKWDHNFFIQNWNVPSLPAKRILRRLQELQIYDQEIGRNLSKDYQDLVEFTGDFG